jgi:RimJ/RimL family protein N-acetyltransferase
MELKTENIHLLPTYKLCNRHDFDTLSEQIFKIFTPMKVSIWMAFNLPQSPADEREYLIGLAEQEEADICLAEQKKADICLAEQEETHIDSIYQPNYLNWWIFRPDNNSETIGNISIRRSEAHPSYAEICYWIGSDFWRHGYASSALELVINYASKMGIKVLYMVVPEGNNGSYELARKHGFKDRKTEKGGFTPNTTPSDAVHFLFKEC